MFDNIGGKIKSLANIVCWIGIISSVISGICIWCMIDPDYTWYLFFVGLIVMAVGSLLSWVSCFVLYGFGELIDLTEENKQTAKQFVELLKESNLNSNSYASNRDVEKEKKDNKKDDFGVLDNTNKFATYKLSGTDKIVCSECNCEQPANRKVCWYCGAKFTNYKPTHMWRCGTCGKMISELPCKFCGKE